MKRVLCLSVTCILACSVFVSAGEEGDLPATEETTELPDLVVTGSRVERSAAQEPVSIYVIPREEIEYAGTRTVSDALRWVPGIDISGGATFGAADRTTALVQGMPAQENRRIGDVVA